MSSSFKSSSEAHFRRTSRLLTTNEFNAVFARRSTNRSDNFSLHQLPERLATTEGPAGTSSDPGPRLGIVVPKKLLRTAVHRNLTKRMVREAFRHLAKQLPHWDLIIRLHRKLDPVQLKKNRFAIAVEITNLLAKTQSVAGRQNK